MAESVKRPVQFNITNHINKCMQEAQEQKQWIDNGGLYYTSTVKLFKERANKLRKIAECYDSMYAYFSSTDINLVKPIDNTDYPVQTEHDTEYVALSELTSLELIDAYIKSNNSNPRASANIELARRLKHKLGVGVDRLSEYIGKTSIKSILELFCSVVVKWFSERCEWPISSRTGRIRYTLSSFPKALDAMILAFSASAVVDESINSDGALRFIKELNDWLYNEGQDHVRGEPDPYKYEKHGLVSTSIVAFSVDCAGPDPLDDLESDSKVFYLACYLENLVKPIVYQDYVKVYGSETECANYYLHSVSNRITNQYHSDVGNLPQSQLHHRFVSEDYNEFNL